MSWQYYSQVVDNNWISYMSTLLYYTCICMHARYLYEIDNDINLTILDSTYSYSVLALLVRWLERHPDWRNLTPA